MSFKNKIYYKIAYKNIQNEKFDKAIKYFKKSFNYYFDNLSFLYNFAYAYYQNENYEECIEILNCLLELSNSCEDAYNLKSSCLVYLGLYDQALLCINKYLENHNGSSSMLDHKKQIEMLNNIDSKGKITLNIVK